MKLSEITEIIPGTILSRVKPTNPFEPTRVLPLVIMQDINYYSGSNLSIAPETAKAEILVSKQSQCVFTQTDDLLYGLTQFRSIIVGSELSGRLVPSNLVVLRIKDDGIDPWYLMWMLNEGPCSKDNIFSKIQGQGMVKLLSVANLRELEISTPPPKEEQKKIGGLYKLLLEKKRIQKRIDDNENVLVQEALKKMNGGNK
jgi:restriction endonuclease S subunit